MDYVVNHSWDSTLYIWTDSFYGQVVPKPFLMGASCEVIRSDTFSALCFLRWGKATHAPVLLLDDNWLCFRGSANQVFTALQLKTLCLWNPTREMWASLQRQSQLSHIKPQVYYWDKEYIRINVTVHKPLLLGCSDAKMAHRLYPDLTVVKNKSNFISMQLKHKDIIEGAGLHCISTRLVNIHLIYINVNMVGLRSGIDCGLA